MLASTLIAVTIAVAAPEPTGPWEGARPQELRRVAEDLFDRGRLEEADAVLAAAYAIDPAPDLLFARARIARARDDCGRAIELWNAYLATGPDAEAAELTQRHIAECQEALGEPPPTPVPEPKPEPAPEPAHAPPSIADSPPPAPPDTTPPWYTDRSGGALLGVGLVTTAIGGGLLGGAFALGARARDASNEMDFRQHSTTGYRLNVAGVTLLGIGAALVVGSVVRYAVVARRRRR
jgi:hypothetical protein